MALASGSQVVLTYIKETTLNTTPGSGNHKVLRATGRNINLEKNILESAEVRSSGQRADVRHGFNQVVGAPTFELALEDYDDAFELAMRNTWAAITLTSANVLSFGAPSSGIQLVTMDPGATLITDGVRPGDFITFSGATNSENDGRFRVVSVPTETTMNILNSTGVSEGTSPSTIAYPGKRIQLGNTAPSAGSASWSVERAFDDLSQYQLFTGVAANSLGISVSPEAIATATLGLLGMGGGSFSGSSGLPGTRTAPTSNGVFAAFDGSLIENGNSIGVVTSLDLNLALNRSLQPVIGSKFSPSVFDGVATVTGTLQAFLDDSATGALGIATKFESETESSLWLELASADGTDWLNLILYRVKFNGATIDPPQSGAIPSDTPFEALENSTYGTAMAIQRSNS